MIRNVNSALRLLSIMRTDEAAKTQHWRHDYGLVEGPNNPEPVDLEGMRMKAQENGCDAQSWNLR
jgi:hypothetical protein